LCAAAAVLGLMSLAPVGLAFAQSPSVAELMAPQPLDDMVMGDEKAPVTVIEYASMTCPHCAHFEEATWPDLKKDYIDTGKVRYIFREFPLDPLAAAAFMLARCAGPEKRDAIVDLLFDKQKDWAFVDKPIEALAATVKQAGISQSDFESCLNNQKLYDQVNQTRENAAKNFHVDATPTFFVNGKKLSGELPIAEFDKAIEPLLK
jgi:protein-disulfide isomerase